MTFFNKLGKCIGSGISNGIKVIIIALGIVLFFFGWGVVGYLTYYFSFLIFGSDGFSILFAILSVVFYVAFVFGVLQESLE